MPCPRCGSSGRNPACGRCGSGIGRADGQAFVEELRTEAAAMARVTVRQLAAGAVRMAEASRGPRDFASQEERVSALREKASYGGAGRPRR